MIVFFSSEYFIHVFTCTEQCWLPFITALGYSELVNSNSDPSDTSPHVAWSEKNMNIKSIGGIKKKLLG